jgi:hypothetical protein
MKGSCSNSIEPGHLRPNAVDGAAPMINQRSFPVPSVTSRHACGQRRLLGEMLDGLRGITCPSKVRVPFAIGPAHVHLSSRRARRKRLRGVDDDVGSPWVPQPTAMDSIGSASGSFLRTYNMYLHWHMCGLPLGIIASRVAKCRRAHLTRSVKLGAPSKNRAKKIVSVFHIRVFSVSSPLLTGPLLSLHFTLQQVPV